MIGIPSMGLREQLVQDVLNFVYEQLPAWRDDPDRPQEASETKLNSQLETFLSVQSHKFEKPYTFSQEKPQTGNRRIDLSAQPLTSAISAQGFSSIYKPITVIEAKRLPIPDSRREREYVTGCASDHKAPGGIQRFKLLLHGADHHIAGMVGYVQQNDHKHHHTIINQWICELADESGTSWSRSEQLAPQVIDMKCGKSRSDSQHLRSDGSTILLRHMWVDMTLNGKTFSST